MKIHGTVKNAALKLGSGMKNMPSVSEVKVKGKEIPQEFQRRIIAADLEMTTDQASELTFTFDDPAFQILESGLFTMKNRVTYRGLQLYVAVLETGEGGGMGGLTVRCRPWAIRQLKDLRGDEVYKQISPSSYIVAECRKAGVKDRPVVQKSKQRKRIKRDVKEEGTTYDPASYPSAWTTMQRLASEEGYLLYEIGGKIYFGQPTWLVSHQPKADVRWYPENGMEPMTIPEIRQSEDSKDLEISLTLPLSTTGDLIPGTGIKLDGFPKYSGTYFINSVAYPLAGDGDVVVDVSTIRNPEPQPRSSGTSDVVGEWVVDADKKGVNCKYTPREIFERAHQWIGRGAEYDGYCQKWVDDMARGYGMGGAADPEEEWPFMLDKTPHGGEMDKAPAGACVFWSGANGYGNGHGHIAISIGDGKMITTANGPIRKANIRDWGTANYRGWKYPNMHP